MSKWYKVKVYYPEIEDITSLLIKPVSLAKSRWDGFVFWNTKQKMQKNNFFFLSQLFVVPLQWK